MAINIDKIKKQYEEENQDGDFETLPVGEYPCFVYELEGTQAKSSGNPMLKITLKVAKGDYKNRQLWVNAVLTAKAWWKVEEFFEAVGYDIDELPETAETAGEIAAAVKEDVLGSKVLAKVSHREWNGKTQENVDKLSPATEGDFEVGGVEEDTPF